MILSNISVPLLGTVDTAVMGHLETPLYLGAVAVGAIIFNFLFMGLLFLRMGTTGLAAQAYGAHDESQMRAVLAQAALLALALAGLLLLLQRPLGQLALWLIAPDPAVAAHSKVYYAIRIWSAPAALANYALIGWFIGLQDARSALWVMLTINLTNIALDLSFVVGLGMKVDGVALATVFAEYSGLALAFALAVRKLRPFSSVWDRSAILNAAGVLRLLKLNGNIFLRSMALMFAFGFFTAQSARLGPLVLAANAVLMNFQHIMAYALDGFAHAAEALVGKAIGRQDDAGFKTAVRVTLRWSLWVAGGFCAIFLLGGRTLIRLLTDLPEVRETAFAFLPWLIVTPAVSVWSFLYDGVYVGATRAREMRDTMLLSLALYLIAWYLLRILDNHGLWLAFLIFMAVRGISMHGWYRYMDKRGGFAVPV